MTTTLRTPYIFIRFIGTLFVLLFIEVHTKDRHYTRTDRKELFRFNPEITYKGLIRFVRARNGITAGILMFSAPYSHSTVAYYNFILNIIYRVRSRLKHYRSTGRPASIQYFVIHNNI